MNELIADVLRLDDLRQAVFRLALAEQVQPVLATSKDNDYAVRAVDLSWSWIEHRDVDGMTLYYLFHDDDDHGVEPAMSISYHHDLVMWNAWGCIGEALAYTGYCAFELEGAPLPETFENAYPDDILTQFFNHYEAVDGPSRVPELLVGFLRNLPDDQLTRAVVTAKMAEFAATAQ